VRPALVGDLLECLGEVPALVATLQQQARALAEDTLTRRRRVLGDDHPDTLGSAHNLAVDLRALGEHHQARELDEDTLTRYRRILGDDHPHTLRSARNLAADLEALGEQERARRWRSWAARDHRNAADNG
jgi:hypothetical protein